MNLSGQVPTLFEALEVISHTPIPLQKWQVKSSCCLCFDNHLGECAISFPLNFRPAAATPGYVVILFYPGRRETCHETPCRKSKVHYLIFVVWKVNVIPVKYRVMEETRVEKKQELNHLALNVSSLTSGWKVGKSRHHPDGAQQWQAKWTSPCSRLSEQRPCRVCAERTIAHS